MKKHELKTIQPYFEAVWTHEKRAELRRDDRGFEVGDELWLREYDAQTQAYPGRYVQVEITHILRDGNLLDHPFRDPQMCMLSFRVLGQGIWERRPRTSSEVLTDSSQAL